MKKFAIIVGGIVVGGLLLMGGCLAVLGGAANEIDKELDKGTTNSKVEAGKATQGGEGKDYSWKALKVSEDEFGSFEGTIRVTNRTDSPAEVFVDVTAYDGEQTLGELNGSARVKPGATTEIPLTSLEDFAEATDYEVEVSGF